MRIHRLALVLLISSSILILGCGRADPKLLLEAAKTALAEKNNQSALIQLKSALQSDPDMFEARYLLGKLLVREGSASAGLIELQKAKELGHPEDELVPELANALLMTGQAAKVVGEFSETQLGKPRADASLQTTLAKAFLVLGKRELAEARIQKALIAAPGYGSAQLVRAQLMASGGDVQGALALVNETVTTETDFSEGWKFKGDLELVAFGRFEAAIDAYRKAVQADPGNNAARVAIVQGMLRQGSLDDAESQLKELLAQSPGNANAKYLEALLSYERRDFEKTRDLSQQLLRALPEGSRVLLLAASAEAELGALHKAEALLDRAIHVDPQLLPAYRLLISIHLRTGSHDRALEVVNSLIERGLLNETMFGLAGQVFLFNGDLDRAQAYLRKSLDADPTDARRRTDMAISRLASGQTSAAFEELNLIAKSTKTTEADLALISVHMQRREFEKALAAIDALSGKEVHRAMVETLRGRLHLAQGETGKARLAFEAALAATPTYYAAVASLAALDTQDKRFDAAKQRFVDLLKVDPGNVRSLMWLAGLSAAQEGGLSEAVGYLKQAVRARPSDPTPRLMWIDLLLSRKDLKEALSVAQSAQGDLPDNYSILDALGRVQFLSGEQLQALATFGKLIPLRPKSPSPYLRLAAVHLAGGDKSAAATQLRKALELQGNLIEAQRQLAAIQLEAKDFASARQLAKTVQQQRPTDPVGYRMDAEIARAAGDRAAEIAAYELGVKKTASAELAVKLHSAMIGANRAADAERFAAEWAKLHPDHVAFWIHLGDVALERGDGPGAQRAYAAALARAPDNAVANNNLAWVLVKTSPNESVIHALKATELAPKIPAFWHTLGTAHLAAGQAGESVKAIRKAFELAPKDDAFRLSLAKALIASGDPTEAKTHLQALAKLGAQFAGQVDVERLLKSLP